MSVIVKPIETGAPMGSGPYLPHVIGDVDLWQHIWNMEVLRGVTAEGTAPSSVPPERGGRPLTVSPTGKAALSGDPAITFDAAAGNPAQASTGAGFSTASTWTLLIVCDVTSGGSQTVRMPGMVAALSASSWAFYGTAVTTAPVAGTGKAVFIVTRNGSEVTVWRNGVKAWTGTITAGTQSEVGMAPTGASKYALHHMRFTETALTAAQITAASADARTLHGI